MNEKHTTINELGEHHCQHYIQVANNMDVANNN